ncbi:zinc finger protein CONSTANS-LIKE 2 [Cajanus cajan]|uniref:Zinc finger protein CONSTANS-LIKE 2 n=1 Tax=Cajanus cajan TaxID=3821 RepID=A0A151S005_CAJCA|nr:zinc finger protein CONSTANS-LIKE 2 [Cajanus cajan]KYP48067.1 Zinc finger protein CONSTANS-LIKE 2 [Cajanus cajan]
MLKEGTNNVGGSTSSWSRVCDTCRSAPCTLYCHADSAYLCSSCDARVHAANRVASRHERVWVCEACERAPAAFLCKADAASLCSSCDADIHSANVLASRHHRVPILPISGSLLFVDHEPDHEPDNNVGFASVREVEEEEEEVFDEYEDEVEAASWLLPHPVKVSIEEENGCDDEGFLFGDEYLDFDLVDCNSCAHNNTFSNVYQNQQNYNTLPQNYAVVPVQVPQQSQCFQPGLDFDSSKAGFSYDGSLSQSVSVSSMDVGVVPESTVSEISMSHSKSSIGTCDLFPPLPLPSHLIPMDREARVLRYREKKKTRKFEKKIRYASRKAYAETRPRIKGRFAKRTNNVEAEVDQMLSTTLFTEVGGSIFPSF